MEPSDLIVPVGLPEEEVTLTCDAKGFPALQYRYSAAFSFYSASHWNLFLHFMSHRSTEASNNFIKIGRCGYICDIAKI